MMDRRTLLSVAPSSFACLAHTAMTSGSANASNPLSPRMPHHPPRARRVVFLCMDGGPSHIDLFDPKPALTKEIGRAHV